MKLRKLLLTVLLAAFVTTGVVGGAVAVKKANAETVAKFTDVNLSISEDFTMKYYVNLPVGAKDVSATFSIDGVKDAEGKVIERTIGISTDNGKKYFAFDGITPQHLGKTINATVNYTLNGEKISFDNASLNIKTVKAYLEQLLANTPEQNNCIEKVDKALKKLSVNILNYGAAAQTFVSDKTELVNTGLTDEQKALATSFESVKNSVKSVLKRSDETTTVDWKSATLVFDNTLELKVKFAVADAYENLKVYANGNQARLVKDETGTYSAYIAVAATEYDKEVVFAVKNGEEAIGSSLTYSVASYINKYLSATEETAMSALAKQAYVYGKSVESYVNTQLPDIEIMCKDMIETENIKDTDKNYLENVKLNEKEGYVMKVSSDNGFKYAGEIRTGQVLKFHVYSEIEAEAELILYASSILRKKWVTTPKEDKWKPTIMGKQQFNTLFTASFEGTDISIADSVELPGFVSQKKDGQNLDDEGRAYDPACWTQWHPVNFGKIKLKKGDNVITMKTVKGGLSNVYKLGVMFVS